MRRAPGLREKIDLGVYPQGLFLLLRNPLIMLGPILATVIYQLILMVYDDRQDVFGLGYLILNLLDAFGMALATLVADMVWRVGRASFDHAWEETRRKARDIIFATLGYSMVITVAGYIGSLLGDALGHFFSFAVAIIFIYAIAACTIGGVPGFMSLQASLNVTALRPINTIIVGLVCLLPYCYVVTLLPLLATHTSVAMSMVILALIRAIIIAYSGTVIAKRYADISFRNF